MSVGGRVGGVAAPLVALLVAGCAESMTGTPGKCLISDEMISVRPFVTNHTSMTVWNDQDWCATWLTSISRMEVATLDEMPQHGTARTTSRSGAIAYGYRPDAGYAGDDRFSLLIHSQFTGQETRWESTWTLVVNVRVEPPAGPAAGPRPPP